MNGTQDKEQARKSLKNFQKDFQTAVKDKKRWFTCLIELLISAALVAVDLITKEYIYGYCNRNGKINVIKGVFSFTCVENTGASFGIFSDSPTALTIVSVICACALVVFMFYSYPRRNLWLRSALILILAGAVGNIVDRIILGYVRDFIYFELINFAVFNFADSCLTVGTIVLIIYILFFYSKEEKEIQDKREAQRKAAAKTDNPQVSDGEKQ
jgi:signal peptidase II